MPDYLSKIVYLTDDQYTTIINNNNTIIGGHKYDPTALYITNTPGNAGTVNGHTVNSDVPYNALFTDHYHTTGNWNGMTYTATSVNNANELSFTLPTIPVSSGGTGVTSFTANSVIMSGSTATANLTTRSIYTLSAAGDSGWNTTANRTKIPDMSFIAYWNGAYNGNSSNITKLGTISTGIWQGTSIKVGYGGTGTTTAPTKGGIIYGASTSAYASTGAGTAGQYLKSNGTDAPTWTTIQPSELGLSNALHFIGITSTVLTDGSTTSTLTAKSTNSLTKTTGFTDGDVVMDGDQLREYIWSSGAWRLLGVTTSTAYSQSASDNNSWIASISQGTDGRITATTGSLSISSGTSTLQWNNEITLATIGGTEIKAALPSNPNTDTLVKQTAKLDNADYKILLTSSSSPVSGNAAEAVYDSTITINPSTHNLQAGSYNGSIKMNTIKAWSGTGPYAEGWKRVCALTGYSGYGVGTVYINGSWSNEEPSLAIFEISFSNTDNARIKQILCAKKTTPDQVRLVYSGTGGKWYFDIHIRERTASTATGNRYITFVGKLSITEKDETNNLLTSQPNTTTVTRELVVSNDQPTITVNLASTSIGSFTGANMTTGITGILPIDHGGTNATSAADARANLGITPANINAATSNHVHGDITNDGKLTNANRIVWTDANKKVYAGYHYANSTKIAVNSSSEPTENLYVSGSIQFNLGTSNTSSNNRKFIVQGESSNKMSIAPTGIQVYNSSNTVTTMYLQAYGGNLIIGASSYATATRDMYGVFDFKSATGFNYSGMGAASDNAARNIWFSYNGKRGTPVYDDDFKYNPSTNTITIGTGTLTATNYSGKAATAGEADSATSASYLTTPSITTEENIASDTRAYQGSGATWTGSITSMQYAGIFQICGGFSRGWQIWARRGETQSLHWRNPNNDANAWTTERTILDSSNTTAPSTTPTLSWNSESTVFTLNGTAVKIKAMAKPTYAFSDLTSHPTTLSDYGITDAATSDHIHGNISNGGEIGVSNNWALASDDGLIVFDASNSYKLERSSIVFDNSTTTEALSRKGTWETVNNVNISADITDNNDYPIPFATSTTSTAIAVAEELQKNTEKLYFNPSSGKLNATKVQVDEHVTLQWNSTDLALEFVFS